MSDDLHRVDCSHVGDRGGVWPCDCDGPTALADLRERLAAAIEARACSEVHATHAKRMECRGWNTGLAAAAQLLRERP